MECLLEVLEPHPLTVRFSLRNPAGATCAQLVPRTLVPVGLFVTLEVNDSAGALLYRSERPKAKLKLHPDKPESYTSLEPGESVSAELSVERDELHLRPGQYRVVAIYSNGPFEGPEGNRFGPLTARCEANLSVG